MIDIKELRSKVLEIVNLNGPVLPVQISRKLGSDTIFAGAVLSELIASKLIKISTAKIGSSPVYYIQGQEEKLSILYDHLPEKEKESYNLLKSHQFLRDKDLEPSLRVALRNLKDFAVPLNINQDLIWKWHLTKDEEMQIALQKQPVQQHKPEIQQVIVKKEQTKKIIKEKMANGDFSKIINKFLTDYKISLIEQQIIRKNAEINMVIKVPSSLGELEFLLIAKNKKSISDSDLTLAFNKAQMKKLPALLISTGDLTKKAKDYLEKNLKGYLIFRNI
ncbi:MAG: hypothetical protein AABY07_07100 [Nanoarchaeota archaeon]